MSQYCYGPTFARAQFARTHSGSSSSSECHPTRPPVPEREAMTAMTRKMKLPRFNSMSPWEPYLAQLRLAAQHCSWDKKEAATRLALDLEAPTPQTLQDLDPADQGKLGMLTTALQCWFGQRQSARQKLAQRYCQPPGEGCVAVAADLRLHTHQGYPSFKATEQDELALHYFLQGLQPEKLQYHVRPHSERSRAPKCANSTSVRRKKRPATTKQ